jgi:hypothetical protein
MDFARRLEHAQARLKIIDMRDTLKDVSDKVGARNWAESFGTRMVRGDFAALEFC